MERPLFESMTGKLVEQSKKDKDAVATTDQKRIDDTRKVIRYHDDIDYQIEDLTETYKPLYEDPDDDSSLKAWKARPKSAYNLVRMVTRIICSLYKDRVVRRFKDEAAKAAWKNLRINGYMQLVDRYTFLSDLVGVRPMVLDGRRTFAIYTGDMIDFTPHPTDPTKIYEAVVSFPIGTGKRRVVKQYWSNPVDGLPSEFCETIDDELQGSVQPNKYDEIPIFFFRNGLDPWSFAGKPATNLVLANRILNKHMTDLDWTVAFQTAGTFVMDDDAGTIKPKIGANRILRKPTGAEAYFTQPNADIPGALALIQRDIDLFLASVGIPEGSVFVTQTSGSGVAIVAEQDSLRTVRDERIGTLGPQEAEFIVFAERIFRKDEGTWRGTDIEPPTTSYKRLHRPMAADERAEVDWMVDTNQTTYADVMAGRLDISVEEAIEQIKENRRLNNELKLPAAAGNEEGGNV